MERVDMPIVLTTAADSKGKIERAQWVSRHIPVLGSLAWHQQRIDFRWAIKKVFDERCTLAVVNLPGTRSA